MSFLTVYCVAFAAFGLAAGRWVALVPAAAAFPLYIGGVHANCWGHGVGDGWEYVVIFTTAAAVVATAAGVALRLSWASRARPR